MPNWCDNVLTVTGPPEDVERFIQNGHGKGDEEDSILSLDSLYPMPIELSETTSPSRIVEKVSCRSAMRRIVSISYGMEGKKVPDQYKIDMFGNRDFKRDGITKKTADALVKKYGTDNWYDWCVGNWGTKWDLSHPEIVVRDQDSVAYQFCTAWAPPITAFDNILNDYPTLEFRLEYEEPGMCFKGVATSIECNGIRTMYDEEIPWPEDDIDYDEDDGQGWS